MKNTTHSNRKKVILALVMSSLFSKTSLCMNDAAIEQLRHTTVELIAVLGQDQDTTWMWQMLEQIEQQPERVYNELFPKYVERCRKLAEKVQQEALKKSADEVATKQKSQSNRRLYTAGDYQRVEHVATDFYRRSAQRGEVGRGAPAGISITRAHKRDLEKTFSREVRQEVEELEKRPQKSSKLEMLDESDSDDKVVSGQGKHESQDECVANVLHHLREIEDHAAVALLMGAKTSVFFLAVTWGDCAVVRCLLEAAENPEKLLSGKDDAGFTPLHWAAGVGHADMVQLLLDAGVDTSVIDKKGRTPYDVARSWRHADIITLLS